MPEPEEFDREAEILPEEILDKHLGGGPDTAVADDPDEPEPDDPNPDDEPEGTPEEEPEEDPEDDEVDEGGDEDPDEDEDEDLEDEEDEEDEEEEEDVLDDKITPEDRQRIKDDPSLAKVHRELLRGFHEKTTELAEKTTELADEKRSVEQRESRVDEFEAKFESPDSAAQYFGWLMGKTPSVACAAFEAIVEGENGADFLVAIGESNPEMLEKVYERVQDLISDEGERARYKRGQAQQEWEGKLNRREQRIREGAFDKDFAKISTVFQKEANRLEIDKEDLKTIETQLGDKIRTRRREDGSIDLTPVEVKEIVREAKKAQDRLEEKVRRRLDRERVGESKKAVKKKAAKGKRKGSVSPKPSERRPVKEHETFEVPDNEDPLDAFVDHRISALTGEK
jgi:hypothetical protein